MSTPFRRDLCRTLATGKFLRQIIGKEFIDSSNSEALLHIRALKYRPESNSPEDEIFPGVGSDAGV